MMASDLSSGCTEAIDILDEKEEGEISLEDVSSSEEGGMGHLTCSYVISRARQCPDCKSWGECASWCTAMYHPKSQSRRDPVKGKENRLHVREVGCTTIKNAASTLQEKNDDLVPISSDSDMEIVGLTDTSNRSKPRIKKKKRKKDYETLTIDDLISPSSGELPISEFDTVKTHYREVSPVHKSSRSRMISKSPIRRYRSPVRTRSPRSPLNYPKSPVQKRSSVQKRSPIQRRSPRRLRSPKRSSPKRSSPHRSPVRIARRPSRQDSPLFARCHINRHNDVTRLLKRVKHLEASVGIQALESSINRNKEHQSSSLKEKLSNMLKRPPDSNDMTHFKEKSNVQSNIVNHDADDEEDLVLLRQKALETKQKKSNRSSDHPADSEKKSTVMRNDDQDEEALQLRMIALRSAVMKKHQNRVQRGIRTNRRPTRSESPFSQCFLDDVPAPSDELLKFASPPCTPPQDSNHIEDMELDTDIEREKEKLPYSPTDVPIDTALLGIEPSDVSFINVNETNSMVFNDITQNDKIDVVPYYDNFPHACEPQVNFVYSPSQHGSETFRSELNTGLAELSSHLRDSHSNNVMCDLIDGICCQGETYSTSVTLMHMPDASCALPVTRNLLVPSIPPENIVTSPQMQQIIEQPIGGILFANMDSTFRDDRCAYEMQAVSGYSITDSPTTFAESMSPNESMITIDDLPEMETDPLSSPIADRNLSVTDHIPKEMMSYQATEEGISREPLYMQGVPEVTKDVNKIPTLINRTLVPVPILKSNKQLQQPLPITRKREKHLEPTFKSAEMQPVVVIAETSAKSGSKPIKMRLTKKPAPVLTTPIAFDNCMKESSENDASEDQRSTASSKSSHEGIELRHCTVPGTTHIAAVNTDTNAALARKKRKHVKKNRCKNLNKIQLIAEKQSDSCIESGVNKDVNIITTSTLERKIVESDQSKSNDDSKVQENSIENRESSLLNITVSQESLSVNSSNIVVENKSVENDQSVSSKTEEESKQAMSLMSAECPQEKSIESHCLLTNPAPNNSDSSATNNVVEMTKDVNRRQSVDEDENELRAILLASLKRTKPTDTNITSTVPITVNCTTTNTETPIHKKALINIPAVTNTTCVVSNSAPLVSTLSSSETVEKKINGTSTSMLRKRSSSMGAVKSLPKKVAKKAPIPASTKVVNNAKKYQNMIVQRKLNLRKLDNARNNAKSNENVWSNVKVPKTSLLSSDTQRFVINLGSDTDSESESEKRKAITVTEKHRAQDVSVDFEESVQKFLRDMRKEQESAAAAKPIVPPQATKRDTPPATQADSNKDSSNMHTPLAVRHLPASQQEEYRRLKQEILEREKLKLQRKVADNSNNNNSSNNSNNKSLSANVTDLPVKSLSPCEKKNTHVKQNQVKLKESEKSSQQSLTSILSISRTSANKSFSANIAKHTNSTHLQTKGIKKTIPNNLSIRITNEIAPSRTSAGNRTIENSGEQQSVSDKQQHRPALRALTKDEINRKYVKVQLKLDSIKRVVTINDKPALRHDLTASASQSEKLVENDNVNMEILDEKDRNNENSNSSAFCNTSTAVLSDLSTSSNTKRKELEDTLENISRSQYEAERQREVNISSPPPENNNSNNASRQFDINADDKGNTDDIWEVLKRDVKTELDVLINFSETDQQQYLRDIEHKLVARRYNVLDHLAEMSGNLRQWDMEKDLQSSLAIEVRKLKEQLKIAEERLQEQRDRVSSMGPKVSTARQNINAGRRECFKLSKICSTLGNRLMGKNYKLPEAGGQLLIDKFKEVANHTRQFTKKKRIQSNDISENSNSNLLERTSPLTESSKVTHTEDDITLQEQPENYTDIADVATSKNDTSCLKQSDDDESLSMTELSLNSSQTKFPNQVTPVREETLINASKSHSDEQATPSNQDNLLFCVPKLNSTSIEQNSEYTQENNSMDISSPATPLELELSVIHPSCQDKQNKKRTLLCQDDQSNKRTSLSSPSPPPPPSQTTITTTMTKMTMIAPYVSILSHLKIPRNMNPHGVLCPYEIMGVCRDEDCQYIHQSRNQT